MPYEALTESERLMDAILKGLLNGDVSTMTFEKTLAYELIDIEDGLQHLLLIDYIEKLYEDGGGTFTITGKGKRFIEKTSFEEQKVMELKHGEKKFNAEKLKEQRAEIEFNWKKKDEKRKNTALFFTLCVVCLGLWNAYIQSNNKGNNIKINAKIDSISEMLSLSRSRVDSLSAIVKYSRIKKAAEVVNKNKTNPKDTVIKK